MYRNTPVLAILLLFCTLCTNLPAQDTLYYSQTQIIDQARKFKNDQSFKTYLLKDSSVLSVGDTVVLGKIPQVITQTASDPFKEVLQGFYTSVISGSWSNRFSDMSQGWEGRRFILTSIHVRHDGTISDSISTVFVYCTARAIGVSGLHYSLLLDMGIDNGEIINPKATLTKTGALNKLKEAKELLNLQVITQAQYDALKIKLSPIVLGL